MTLTDTTNPDQIFSESYRNQGYVIFLWAWKLEDQFHVLIRTPPYLESLTHPQGIQSDHSKPSRKGGRLYWYKILWLHHELFNMFLLVYWPDYPEIKDFHYSVNYLSIYILVIFIVMIWLVCCLILIKNTDMKYYQCRFIISQSLLFWTLGSKWFVVQT